ncbi:hypothetical protein A2U01_0058490, partial [Trifolium medium]|nr:hypothetical protein [Trifolium medium]
LEVVEPGGDPYGHH